MEYITQAHSYWQKMPPAMQAAFAEEAQAMGVDVIHFLASRLRGMAGGTGNSTMSNSFKAQQQGAKRSRIEAAKDKSCTMLPAQMRMGRGAELAFQQQNILAPIKFKTGEPNGKRIVDAFSREHMLYKPQVASMAFAYKMQLEPPSFLVEDNALPINRFVTHNVFRHVLTASQSNSPNSLYGKNTVSWNNTLGPDKSYVRRLGAVENGDPVGTGSAYSAPPATSGLNTTLQSPYRYPQNGDFMYSRMSRRALENLGWNANPMKIAAIDSGAGTVTGLTYQTVYANADNINGQLTCDSMPNLHPPGANQVTQFGASYYYRSQMSRGELAYNFANEGTNPIVVDIVITRLKKGHDMIKEDLVNTMVAAYERGYLNYSYANRNQADYQGQPPTAVDVTTNARGPFLPAKALDNYRVTTLPAGGPFENQQNPYKQVARDQFIISGGSTRAWSMYLQSMDYDARKYSQYQSIDLPPGLPIESNDNACACVDDLSYIISIAVSGVPAPYIEQPIKAGSVTAPLNAIVDRRGTEASCAVTGMYKEHCHPVYLTLVNNDTYINGKLDIASFDEGASPTLGVADILSIANATRGSDEASALIAMGPLNSVGGG